MRLRLDATQSVEFKVEQQQIPIQQYLRKPQRLIGALADPSRVEQLSAECFRLKMRPLNFMMLHIQPTVDLHLSTTDAGVIHLKSVGSEILGLEYVNQRFHLNLVGELAPTSIRGNTYLVGVAHLNVEVDLPPALMLTPRAILERTGNSLLNSVLVSIKQRLMQQLVSDYRVWVADQESALAMSNRPMFSPN